jgi:dehydrogenase/reductase SDR family member 1
MAVESEPPLLGPNFISIVTGASRGVGRGIALALGRAGATVFVTGRTHREGDSKWPGSIETTAQDVTKLGGHGVAVQCDSSRDDELRSLLERVVADAGCPNLLVNNAYSLPPEFDDTPRGIPFWELPQSVWDHSLGVGLRSHYLASVLVVPHMLRCGRGLIVNISSSAADGYLFSVPYGVAKAAIERMTADMALELHDHGIVVVALRPGPVRTERIIASPWNAAAASLSIKRLSPLSVGSAVIALALHPELSTISGHAISVGDLISSGPDSGDRKLAEREPLG